jgi:hypothetical protein
MKPYRIGIAAACLLLFAASLSAQLTHTWVSAAGNDGTCTGTTAKPCASFAQAISLTAVGGTISVLGPGDYGAVTITQSITIDGTGGGTINFAGDGEGIYIDPSVAANIVLRNLSIDGGGTGSDAIFIASAGTTNTINVVIDGCLIAGFTQIGVGLGSESPMYVTVRNTSIQGGTLGVRTFQSTGAVVYDHVQLDHVDIQGATSSGVFTRNGNVDILNSTISGNTGSGTTGIEADTSATLNVQHSMITSNTNGTCIYTGSTAVIGSTTTVADNGTNVEATCGGAVQGIAGPGPSPKL